MATYAAAALPDNELADAYLLVRRAEATDGPTGRVLRLQLYDATGEITGLMEGGSYPPPAAMSLVKLRGTTEERDGQRVLLIQQIRPARQDDEYSAMNFFTQTVADLKPGLRFAGFLLVRSAEQRTGKNGKNYLDINLADCTGEINGKVWDGTVAPPPSGTVVRVRASVDEYQGRPQLRIEAIAPAKPEDEVDMSRLVACAPDSPEHMLALINGTIDRFESEKLKTLVREMLRLAGDPLSWYPAAQRMHHAERSGLLHHTTDMLKVAEQLIVSYPYLRGDLLRAGVILHDLGKLKELKSDQLGNVSDYTRDGILVGHLVRGVVMVETAAANVGVTGEVVELLQHMIISHHGVPEYGSPRLPMIPEAEALHWIDTLDARMNEMQAIQRRTPEGAFSEPIKSLDNRRMYHAYYTDSAE